MGVGFLELSLVVFVSLFTVSQRLAECCFSNIRNVSCKHLGYEMLPSKTTRTT